VFGVSGERVWGQEWESLPAGPHNYSWDGLTSARQHVGSGLYYVRLTTAAGVRRTRLVRLR
jgi:flagellar hook assembly protein FlgD